MEYIDNFLHIQSDYKISTFKEWEFDKDILIFLHNRCVNLNLPNLPQYITSRIQLPCVEKILIRYCKNNTSTISTIHFLKDSDMHSTIMNFELDYSNFIIEIKNCEFYVEMNILLRD